MRAKMALYHSNAAASSEPTWVYPRPHLNADGLFSPQRRVQHRGRSSVRRLRCAEGVGQHHRSAHCNGVPSGHDERLRGLAAVAHRNSQNGHHCKIFAKMAEYNVIFTWIKLQAL